jgi:hypothetical protein
MQPETTPAAQAVTIEDFAEYSAVVREILHATWFITDTAKVLDEADGWFDGSIGNPTPYYGDMLRQLIRTACGKQMSLIERLEDLTSIRPDLTSGKLSVLDLPKYPEKVATATSNA